MSERLQEALKLYLVMGLESIQGRSAFDMAASAIAGGVTMLQLREKKAPLPQVLQEGRRLRELCREQGVLFLVNDRVDVAMLLDADGVHVGQDDIPGSDARRLLGPNKIIGISAGNEEEAKYAVSQGADYFGIGPVYSTATKDDAGEPIGTDLIATLRKRYPQIPSVGIGGIQASNAAKVIAAGASGIAVVSAITRQDDPKQAASGLLNQIAAARK